MDERTAVEKFLRCFVCDDIYLEPVSLGCNHSFCSSCLQQFWQQAGNKNCPVCKRKSSKDLTHVNFGLKELADLFGGRRKPVSPEGGESRQQAVLVCQKHQQKPNLFCVEEQRVLCTVCHYPHDGSHNVIPVGEAVAKLKEQLRCDFDSLQDKRIKHLNVQKTYGDVVRQSKNQVESTERKIRAEFNQLHQFLREEEESRLAALREEEQQKAERASREMKTIEQQISSLSECIDAVEAELQKSSAAFLSTYRDVQNRVRSQGSPSEPPPPSGLLIDVAKHLGNLSFSVWSKMKEQVRHAPVVLDPNTAASSLHLSDDLTSVRYGSTQQLPKNPERLNVYIEVLGSEGFSSGRHSWEVEVGDLPSWGVGLVKESVDRAGERFVSTEDGFWCLWHSDGGYTNGGDEPIDVENLQRIRVQLDYDNGTVSFSDATGWGHIYSYRDTFTEKLFPYFHVGKTAGVKTKSLTICPTEIVL